MAGSVLSTVLAHLEGVKCPNSKGWYTAWCPFHPDGQGKPPHQPNLGLTEQGFSCSACGAHGSLYDLAKKLEINLGGQDVPNRTHLSDAEAICKLKADRLLRDETISHFQITPDQGAQVWRFPVASGHWRFNAYSGGNTNGKAWHDKGTPNQLYGLPDIPQGTAGVWWVNGEPAVWVCFQAGIAAVCGLFGEGRVPPGAATSLKAKSVRMVNVPPDSDSPGRKAALKVNAELERAGLEVRIRPLPDSLGDKADLCDLYKWLNGGDAKFVEALASLPVQDVAVSPTTGLRLTPLADLLQEPQETISWLWQDTLPSGGLSLLAAKPKVGKSTFARNLALAVARGECFLGWDTSQGCVVYLALEDKCSEVARHFRNMGAGDEPIQIHVGVVPEEALSELTIAIKQTKARLAIIDPILRMVRLRDANAYAEVTLALEPLLVLARDTGCHILMVHHEGKGAGFREVGDGVLGSSAFFGAVDAALILRKAEDRRSLESRQRYGMDMPKTVLSFDPVMGILEVVGTAEELEGVRAREAIIDLVKDDGEFTQDDIRGIEGFRTQTLRRALTALMGDGVLERAGGGRKGDPFRYRVARNSGSGGSQYIAGTSKPEFFESNQALGTANTEDNGRKSWEPEKGLGIITKEPPLVLDEGEV